MKSEMHKTIRICNSYQTNQLLKTKKKILFTSNFIPIIDIRN